MKLKNSLLVLFQAPRQNFMSSFSVDGVDSGVDPAQQQQCLKRRRKSDGNGDVDNATARSNRSFSTTPSPSFFRAVLKLNEATNPFLVSLKRLKSDKEKF